MESDYLVEIKNLTVSFRSDEDRLIAVDGVSFNVKQGEVLGIVGESGCGKSLTSLAIMDLLPRNAESTAECLLFDGEDLVRKDKEYRRKLRGNRLSMIFQEPMTSLNPVLKIGRQMTEVLEEHSSLSKKDAFTECIEMLEKVGITSPDRCMNSYPFQMSGGMRQRIMIAMALLCKPMMLIADEPTTALDVTIQAQILDLIKRLSSENNMSVILITHDLGVIAETCDRVLVMYAGEIVEQGNVVDLFTNPRHPYTIGLMNSIPQLDNNRSRLNVIRGIVPGLSEMPTGCKFNPRCDFSSEKCLMNRPHLQVISENHSVACYNCRLNNSENSTDG